MAIKRITQLALVGALVLFGGCTSAAVTPTSIPPTPISLQLSWIHEYSSAPFYAALENGHYQAENLQVTFQPGGFVDGRYIDPVNEVVSGASTFGMGDAASLITARAAGQPITAVMTVLQRSPTALISLAETDIQQPNDLIGKTVAAADGSATELLHTMLLAQDINLEDVNIIERTDFGIDPLLNGDVDALVGWIINEGVQVREAGRTPNFMLLSDYGIPAYTFTVFTTDSIVQEQPEMVERFVRATIAGMNDVIANPDGVVDFVLRYNAELDRAQQLERLQTTIPLINVPGVNVGAMDRGTWEQIHQLLIEQEQLVQPVDVADVYTLDFLERVYPASR